MTGGYKVRLRTAVLGIGSATKVVKQRVCTGFVQKVTCILGLSLLTFSCRKVPKEDFGLIGCLC